MDFEFDTLIKAATEKGSSGKLAFASPDIEEQYSYVADLVKADAEAYHKPRVINSAYRDPERNKRANGSPTSYHMSKEALDYAPVSEEEDQDLMQYYADLGYNVIDERRTKNHIHVEKPGASSVSDSPFSSLFQVASSQDGPSFDELVQAASSTDKSFTQTPWNQLQAASRSRPINDVAVDPNNFMNEVTVDPDRLPGGPTIGAAPEPTGAIDTLKEIFKNKYSQLKAGLTATQPGTYEIDPVDALAPGGKPVRALADLLTRGIEATQALGGGKIGYENRSNLGTALKALLTGEEVSTAGASKELKEKAESLGIPGEAVPLTEESSLWNELLYDPTNLLMSGAVLPKGLKYGGKALKFGKQFGDDAMRGLKGLLKSNQLAKNTPLEKFVMSNMPEAEKALQSSPDMARLKLMEKAPEAMAEFNAPWDFMVRAGAPQVRPLAGLGKVVTPFDLEVASRYVGKDTPITDVMIPPGVKNLTDTWSEDLISEVYKAGLDKLDNAPGKLQATKKFFREYWGDIGSIVAERQPRGGELVQQAHKGATLFRELQDGYSAESEIANRFEKKMSVPLRRRVSNQIFGALGDRERAADYLKTKEAKELYPVFEKIYDYWDIKRGVAGYKNSKDDYVPHMLKERSESIGLFKNKLPDSVASNFNLRRNHDWDDVDLKDNIFKLTRVYGRSMAKAIAYDDMMKVVVDLEDRKLFNNVGKEFVTSVAFPDFSQVGQKFFGKITDARFTSLLRYNIFNAAENTSQVEIARARVPAEAQKLANKLLNNADELGIKSYLDSAFEGRAKDAPTDTDFKIGSAFDFFQKSERANWRKTRALGMAKSLYDHPIYTDLVKNGVDETFALKFVLQNPAWSKAQQAFDFSQTALQRAQITGNNLARITQFPSDSGLRPKFFQSTMKHPMLRPFLQFKRFDAASFEALMDGLSSQGKEKEIIARGFSDEVPVVESLHHRRAALEGVDVLVKQGALKADDAAAMKSAFKDEISQLEAQIKVIEPTTKLRALMHSGKFIVKSWVPRYAKGSTSLHASQAITGQREKQTDVDVAKRALINTMPGLGTSAFLTELITGSGSIRIASERQIISFLLQQIPGVGVVEGTVPGQIPSRTLSSVVKGKEVDRKSKLYGDGGTEPSVPNPRRDKANRR